MPRYFFDLTGFTRFVDATGVELADDDAAWSAAVKSLGETLKDMDGRTPNGADLALVVREGGGRRVAVLRFTGERGGVASENHSGRGDDGRFDRPPDGVRR